MICEVAQYPHLLPPLPPEFATFFARAFAAVRCAKAKLALTLSSLAAAATAST